MADREHARAGRLAVRLDPGDEVGLGGDVEHRGHLVADQVAGAQRERAGDAGALELPVGHLVRAPGEQVRGEPQLLGELGGAVHRAAVRAQRLLDDLGEGEPGVHGEPGLLEDERDRGAQLPRRPVPPPRRRGAVDHHMPGGGPLQQGEHPGEGGLAASARPGEPDGRARRYGDADPVEDPAAAVPDGDVVSLKHGAPAGGGRRPARPASSAAAPRRRRRRGRSAAGTRSRRGAG